MEVIEVYQFLKKTLPFSYLDQQSATQLSQQISVYYFQAGQPVDVRSPRLLIVRSGIFAAFNQQHQLLGKLQERDFFGYQRLLSNTTETGQLVCEEDGLVYWLEVDAFRQLLVNQPKVAEFFHALAERSLHKFKEVPPGFHLTLKVGDLIGPRKITISPDKSILEAAQLMTEMRVSTVLVEDQGKLLGLVTDRDLRSRVLAEGRSLQAPISSVMTESPQTIGKDSYLFEAIQSMGTHNIHHLPVLENELLYGMLSITDIIRVQQDHPVYLIGNIHKQTDFAGLKTCSESIKPLLVRLSKQHLPAHEISQVITTITDALTKRLLKLAELELGEAPCEFCWIVFGSQARMDQSINSDQDNALILELEPRGYVEDYFAKLADFVCQGLDQCGVPLCPGNIMAANPALRLSLAGWQQKIEKWIHSPSPESMLQSTIFFDLRGVGGNRDFARHLQQHFLDLTSRNTLFQYHLAQTALQNRAPLGLFKGFILTHEGEQRPGCDLKKNGTALINDIARVYALALGLSAVSTRQRLQVLAESSALDKDYAQNLLDAFDLIAQLRWDKHVQDMDENKTVTNLVDPLRLHNLQRHQLKDCFTAINEAQAIMRFRFCRGI